MIYGRTLRACSVYSFCLRLKLLFAREGVAVTQQASWHQRDANKNATCQPMAAAARKVRDIDAQLKDTNNKMTQNKTDQDNAQVEMEDDEDDLEDMRQEMRALMERMKNKQADMDRRKAEMNDRDAAHDALVREVHEERVQPRAPSRGALRVLVVVALVELPRLVREELQPRRRARAQLRRRVGGGARAS